MHRIDSLSHSLFNLLSAASGKSKSSVCIGVASANRQEGRTFIVESLAVSAALNSSLKLALVDADLKGRSLTLDRGAASAVGVSDVLAAEASNAELIRTSMTNLVFVGAGRIPEPALLYQREAWSHLLHWLGAERQAILFDMPCFREGAEPVLAALDHILVVVDASRTPRSDVQELVDAIPESKRWGVVLNKAPLSPALAKTSLPLRANGRDHVARHVSFKPGGEMGRSKAP
jgi:Mrp family chromosome partitioning ATPase